MFASLLFVQIVKLSFWNDLFPFSGDWKDLEFKDYNYEARGQPIAKGYVHPLMEVYL
jgi:phenylalanyl-tRNA synthetase alpha subunit